MSRISENDDGTFSILLTKTQWRYFTRALCDAINSESRAKNTRSGNKPLASGKPAKRSAKGVASKAGKQARKGAGKK